MARRSSPPPEPDIPRSVDAATGIALLRKQVEKAKGLLAGGSVDTADHTAWNNVTRSYLVKVFGSKSPNVNEVIHASSSVVMHLGASDYEGQEYMRSLVENQIKMLEGCIEQLETEIELSTSQANPRRPIERTVQLGDRVFLVHGSDHGIKETVARAITALGLDPLILHEQPNRGRTLIEKFVEYADVGFAIVLLTADDVGRASTEEGEAPRARQNVIFELGYFIGRLGRERVCALYTPDTPGVELPSDFEGVVYVELDAAGKWKFDLVRELKAAGYNVDANKLFQ